MAEKLTKKEEMQQRDKELREKFIEKPLYHIEAADERKLSLTSYMEALSPTDGESELDTFQRLLQKEGLRTTADPAMRYSASPVIDFLKEPYKRALLVEVLNRAYREIALRAPTYSSDDTEAGTIMRPYIDGSQKFDKMVAPVVPLSELISTTTQIAGQDYRTLLFEYDENAFTEERVPEGAPLPIARMRQSENVIQLFKRGIRFQVTYEFMRRTQAHVDKLALQMQKIAVHRELAKVKLAVKTMIEGDGNPNTEAQIYNLYSLDDRADGYPATGSIVTADNQQAADAKVKLTLKAWLNFKKNFANPYTMTTILMNQSMATNLELLDMGTNNTPLVELQGLANRLTYGQLRPINIVADGIRYGWLDEIPEHQILGFDNRFAVEQIVEIGGDIAEMDRFIHNQTEEITMSENYGMGILDQECCRILDASPENYLRELDADATAHKSRKSDDLDTSGLRNIET